MCENWKKTIIRLILWAGCGAFLGISFGIAQVQCSHQQLAQFWGNDGKWTQVSVFFSEYEMISKQDIISAEEGIQQSLEKSGVLTESEKKPLSISSYSSEGMLSVKGTKAEKTMQAIGVGGDFFSFHPLLLKSGTWFDSQKGNSKMVVLNEAAAWEIFGSSNIIGMEVQIGGTSYRVSGVVEGEEGPFLEKSGVQQCQIYLPYNILRKYQKNKGITCYEIIMPNPVQGFAVDVVQKQTIGSGKNVEIVENTNRFSLQTCFKRLPDFFVQSIRTNEVQYPFWENIARAWESVQNLLLIFQIIWAGIGLIYIGRFIIFLNQKLNFVYNKIMKNR